MHRKLLNQYFKTDGWVTPTIGEKRVDNSNTPSYNKDIGATTYDLDDSWKNDHEKELRYAGDSARESVDKGLKETSKFIKDAPDGTNYSDVQSASVKWSLANDTDNKELKQSAFDELTGLLSTENKEEYLKKARPLQEFVDAKDTFDYNHNNYTTTKNSNKEFSVTTYDLQQFLNSEGFGDKFGESLKEDGIMGAKTLYAYDQMLEAENVKSSNEDKKEQPVTTAQAVEPTQTQTVETDNRLKDALARYHESDIASRGGSREESVEEKVESNKSYYLLPKIEQITTLSDTIKTAESLAYKSNPQDGLDLVNRLRTIGLGLNQNTKPTQIKNFVKQIANELFLPVDFALAVIEQESGYDHWRGGKVNENNGDYGLMQINKNSHPDAFNSKVLDVVNNWQHNVIYGLTYLKYCFDEAVRLGYRNNDLLKAAYSNYNSFSCSAYKNPNHDAYGNVNLFWLVYTERRWEKRK